MKPAVSPLRRLVDERRDEIVALVRANRGSSVAVFGSVARGEDRQGSDIDFLVEFRPGSSLFDLARLTDSLRELLGVDVDVVSVGGLRNQDGAIRREAVPL